MDINKEYYSKNGYDYKVYYRFIGWGIDSQPIYKKLVTKWNIARGCIYFERLEGYATEDKKPYTGYIR